MASKVKSSMLAGGVFCERERNEYLTQNVDEYPLAALLIAGMIGYGLAYLIHTRWQNQVSW